MRQISDRKNNFDDYALPTKTPLIQVSLSLVASFMSSISLLGTSAEGYRNGASFILIFLSYPFAILITNETFIPYFYKNVNISIFE
ncbi:hypothetical protein A3Q56_01462, partial [Intoshia linei]